MARDMARRFIDPAKPPLPALESRPFHPEAGSQTSNWMSESAEGLSVPVTLQKAGTSAGGPGGMARGPAATGCALVTVVVEKASLARLSHVALDADAGAGAAANGRRSRSVMAAIMGDIFLPTAAPVDGRGSRR